MGHTYHQNYGHLVFHVADVTITQADIENIHAYIFNVAKSQGVTHLVIGGIEDHVHLLGEFPLSRKTADIVRSIKANSSYYCKRLGAYYKRFAWQEGYGYFSVSPSQYRRVADYIRRQAERHATMTAEEELRLMLQKTAAVPDIPQRF